MRLRLLTTLITLLWAACLSNAEPIDVWMDVDVSMGVVDTRARDVDDGLALIYAFRSPEIRVRGVSCVFGNTSLENAVPITRDIVKRFGPAGLPVAVGAASGAEMGQANEAVDAMAAGLRDRPMHLLALGPVTNVASLLKLHPEVKDRIQSIVIVAARRPGFRFGPPQAPTVFFPDANFEKDVPGTQVLLDSGVPIVFAGYEVSSTTWITPADFERIRASGPLGTWIVETSTPWIEQWIRNMNTPGFNPFDALGVAWITHPQLIDGIPVTAKITEDIDERAKPEEQQAGKTKPYLIAEPTEAESKLIYLTVPKPEFHDVLVERLAKEAPTTQPSE